MYDHHSQVQVSPDCSYSALTGQYLDLQTLPAQLIRIISNTPHNVKGTEQDSSSSSHQYQILDFHTSTDLPWRLQNAVIRILHAYLFETWAFESNALKC